MTSKVRMLSERSQTYRCVFPFIRHSGEGKTLRTENRAGIAKGWGSWEGVTTQGMEKLGRGLELYGILRVVVIAWLYAFVKIWSDTPNRVNNTACKFLSEFLKKYLGNYWWNLNMGYIFNVICPTFDYDLCFWKRIALILRRHMKYLQVKCHAIYFQVDQEKKPPPYIILTQSKCGQKIKTTAYRWRVFESALNYSCTFCKYEQFLKLKVFEKERMEAEIGNGEYRTFWWVLLWKKTKKYNRKCGEIWEPRRRGFFLFCFLVFL